MEQRNCYFMSLRCHNFLVLFVPSFVLFIHIPINIQSQTHIQTQVTTSSNSHPQASPNSLSDPPILSLIFFFCSFTLFDHHDYPLRGLQRPPSPPPPYRPPRLCCRADHARLACVAAGIRRRILVRGGVTICRARCRPCRPQCVGAHTARMRDVGCFPASQPWGVVESYWGGWVWGWTVLCPAG